MLEPQPSLLPQLRIPNSACLLENTQLASSKLLERACSKHSQAFEKFAKLPISMFCSSDTHMFSVWPVA